MEYKLTIWFKQCLDNFSLWQTSLFSLSEFFFLIIFKFRVRESISLLHSKVTCAIMLKYVYNHAFWVSIPLQKEIKEFFSVQRYDNKILFPRDNIDIFYPFFFSLSFYFFLFLTWDDFDIHTCSKPRGRK